jgi:hypothetical protein
VLGKRLSKSVEVGIVFAVLLTLGASSSLVNNVVIQSVGTIAPYVTAASGSAADIQNAVNQVANTGNGLGTVIIPAGTWIWQDQTVKVPAGVNIIGTGLAGNNGHTSNWTANTPQTILFQNETGSWGTSPSGNTWNGGYDYNPMFLVFGPPTSESPITVKNPYAPTLIEGIYFQITPPINAYQENEIDIVGAGWPCIEIYEINNWRVAYCTFVNWCVPTVCISPWNEGNSSATNYGVCDHCTFINSYELNNPGDVDGYNSWEWGTGIMSWGAFSDGGNNVAPTTGWSEPITAFYGYYGPMPGYSITYSEDDNFTYVSECIDGLNGGFSCVRFDVFNDASCAWGAQTVEVHGPNYESWGAGGRGLEVYNCTFNPWPASQVNTNTGDLITYPWIDAEDWGMYLRGGAALFYNNTYHGNGVDCLVGLTETDDSNDGYAYLPYGMDVNQTFIWNNVYGDCTFLSVDSHYTLGNNYFLTPPNSTTLSGFTYTPYPYPNPITLSNG